MDPETPDVVRAIARRQFLMRAASGTVLAALGGGLYLVSDRLTGLAKAQTRADGRPRLPPGQRVIESLKPMGGTPGDPNTSNYRLRVHGEVDAPFKLDFAELVALGGVTQHADVHCVTGWTVLDAKWTGVQIKTLAERAKVRSSARYVIFEAAGDYTANVRLRDALSDASMVTWELDDRPLRRAHGAPVRALVPDVYFWKSAKWLTGIKFVAKDEPGYWEVRGYHNHADPWKEQRYG